MNILEAKNLNKYFYDPKKFKALDNLDLTIEKGDFVSITGKSGSGKSTLLYLLSTMDTDFEGSININGSEMQGRNNSWLADFRNKHIGFVFQFHFLLPEFSVLKNVMLPGLKRAAFPPQELEQKAMDLLKLLDVQDQALKRASLLSGGQQQRVAIARALINDPLILMGDEPTGNLDSKNTGLVFDLFKKLSAEQHQTMLIVTHDEEFAKNTDKTIHISDGRIS
ncbi:lipoprotein-releasing system ATP-binding protein [Pedobacter steynii]|uniref:Lipoprotein-releasing system ATP-binding protein n=1 Tax=Pedobacter steynii TaxID=430522 RepID=A0A1H0C692_9SPHI|nr:ABC transporter ATP-binding protein [Pedobacter steynii]NQX41481.1 ABC transporter ATP-binding protein [Pedobacter steynii]SDN53414.1 lipoprotein-releasing system ATP-binding protein [Pedobacter steynii]